jgi:hypothetical protein
VRVDAQESFAEGDEDIDVEKRIRGQVVKLNPIDKKEAADELMNGNSKVADEKVNKSYMKTRRCMRGTLIPWHLHGLLVEHAHPLEQAIVPRGDLGPLPAGDLVLLHAFVGARGAVMQRLVRGAMVDARWSKLVEAKDECARSSRRKKNRGREDVRCNEGGKVRRRIEFIGGRQ